MRVSRNLSGQNSILNRAAGCLDSNLIVSENSILSETYEANFRFEGSRAKTKPSCCRGRLTRCLWNGTQCPEALH